MGPPDARQPAPPLVGLRIRRGKAADAAPAPILRTVSRPGWSVNAAGLIGLAEAADGFTGSELEQAVVSGLFATFAEKAELCDRHLYVELSNTRPLSTLMAERIEELRAWAEDRCVPAD